MLRFLLVVLVLFAAVGSYVWFSANSLPSWYDEAPAKQNSNLSKLSKQVQNQGVANFLGGKFADVMRGEVTLNETEFNALLMASLASHEDGRRLLNVSDKVHAQLRKNEIELGAVINIAKLRRAEPKARKAFEKAVDVLPFDLDDKLFIAIKGLPVARNGNLGLDENVSLKIGSLPISNSLLRSAGVSVADLATESLPIKSLSIRSVNVEKGQIRIGVRPRF